MKDGIVHTVQTEGGAQLAERPSKVTEQIKHPDATIMKIFLQKH